MLVRCSTKMTIVEIESNFILRNFFQSRTSSIYRNFMFVAFGENISRRESIPFLQLILFALFRCAATRVTFLVRVVIGSKVLKDAYKGKRRNSL